MENHSYYAVLYVYDKDGSQNAYIPCFSEEQVLLRASKYYPDFVRVVPNKGTAFRIRVRHGQKASGHDGSLPESVVLPTNGHHSCSYDASGSIIHATRPPLPPDLVYDGWQGRSGKKITF